MKEIVERYKSILLEHEILVWENEPTAYRFKARFYFIDGSDLIQSASYFCGRSPQMFLAF